MAKAKQKIYVEEHYVYEYEMPANMDAEEVEEFIKKIHPANSIGPEFGNYPGTVQYMIEDSEWTEIHGVFD